MTLRDYQIEARNYLASHNPAFIVAPAGSGKTIIAAAAIQQVSPSIRRAVCLVNTIEQVDQVVAALKAFPCSSDLDIDVECVAAQPDVSQADLILMDEAHHGPAETWANLLNQAKPGCRLWGMSATPWHDKDEQRNTYLARKFKNFFEIETDRVRDSGHLCDGRVIFHDVDTPGVFDEAIRLQAEPEFRRLTGRRYEWDDTEDMPDRVREIRQQCLWRFTPAFVQTNRHRNNRIAELIRSECETGESVLVLVSTVIHGEMIVGECHPWGHLVHSKIGKKSRGVLIESARRGDIRCLVSTSLADEGLDIPRLSRVIMACGGRSTTKLTQRIGRVLRPFENKGVGICHDFLDRGAELANAQAWSRYKAYKNLGYEVEIQ